MIIDYKSFCWDKSQLLPGFCLNTLEYVVTRATDHPSSAIAINRPGLVQKSKQLEDELLRERSLRQDLARSPLRAI